MITSPLDRQTIRNLPGRIECVACEGSGVSSAGPPCFPCQGTGSVLTEAAKEGKVVVQHSSETNEHYTPKAIVEAARKVLGKIELDPASCELGNSVVKAEAWYGPGSPIAEDGLAEPWLGKVFLNPPGGLVPKEYEGLGTKSNSALWWSALAGYWAEGEVETAIFIGFTLEILRSTQALDVPQPLDFPLCVPKSRIKFDTVVHPHGGEGERIPTKQPSHANVIVYLPPKAIHSKYVSGAVDKFAKIFSKIGHCRI